MSYYQKYRPQTFADLIGQDYIAQILRAALVGKRLSHAYLFCGTRGTGKTTTARILAKAVNCPASKDGEPCNACELCQSISNGSCIDVVEIDAASNRGIEEIRQLQDQARFKPQAAQKKIFIIDEVHMLTKEAFNALLKTLEEPPAYLLFILATTESHKIPATILSRCQRFDFQTPQTETIQRYLQRVADGEKLKIEEAALSQIAELANGSFRDSSTIIEQLATHGEKITAATIREVLGLPETELIDRYLTILSGQTDPGLLADATSYFDRGGNPTAFIDTAFRRLEQLIRDTQLPGSASAVLSRLVRVKHQLKYSPISRLPILASLSGEGELKGNVSDSRPAAPTSRATVAAQVAPLVAAIPEPTPPAPQVVEKKAVEPVAVTPAPEPSPETVTIAVAEQVPPAELPDGKLTEVWEKALGLLLEDSQSSMVAMLRTAKPVSWQAPILTIAVQFAFHADQIGRQKNRGILEATLSQCLGSPVRVETVVQPATDLATVAEEMF